MTIEQANPEVEQVDVRGRGLLYGLIATATVAAASHDPQMEVLRPLLMPVGYGGSLGLATLGLRHMLVTSRSNGKPE